MPIEVLLLAGKEAPLDECPNCGDKPFRPFLRGQVQRSSLIETIRAWWQKRKPRYCAVICWECKDIVGWE
jgi:hypothetical protein